jgi:6-phosphofructokinase 1
MEKRIRTIGVLSSGGDAPGMNAAIRSVVRTAINRGMNVMGIRRGYEGLLNGDMFEMNLRSVSDTLHRGGTMLYTARCPEFATQEGVLKGRDMCVEMGIDGLVVIGGDGSFRGARDLSLAGVPCIGITGTIDNDISSSEYTVGFDTALNTVVEMVDRLRDTSQSHDRCTVVEVMGRHCGDIAVHAGIAIGATSILVPEIPHDLDRDVIAKMNRTIRTGKQHFIIMVAEGVGGVDKMAKYIEEKTGVETRATILGHVQRGGSPTAKDRIVASQMGYHAVQLLKDGIGNRVVAIKKENILDFDIFEALGMKNSVDLDMYKMALEISI